MGLLNLGGIFGFYAPQGLTRHEAEAFLEMGLSSLRHRGEGGWRLFFAGPKGEGQREGDGLAPLSLPEGPFVWGLGTIYRRSDAPGWIPLPGGVLVFTGRLEGSPRQLLAGELPLEGAFAFLAAQGPFFYAGRDGEGRQPLSGVREKGAYFFASEHLPGFLGSSAEPIPPGTFLRLSPQGAFRERLHPVPHAGRLCAFEALYYARPDGLLAGRRVYALRYALGRLLAREAPSPADVVVGVPDSGTAAAHGYAEESRLPLAMGLWKNPYAGRAFLRASPKERDWVLDQKLFPIPEAVAGRRVVLVDDSIVRGATVRRNARLLRQAGAKEIHVRIAAPPVVKACPYGLLGAEEEELFHRRPSLPVESLAYLSLSAMEAILAPGFCRACFGKEAEARVSL